MKLSAPELKLTITTRPGQEINLPRLRAVLLEITELKKKRPELFISPGPGESLPINDTTKGFS